MAPVAPLLYVALVSRQTAPVLLAVMHMQQALGRTPSHLHLLYTDGLRASLRDLIAALPVDVPASTEAGDDIYAVSSDALLHDGNPPLTDEQAAALLDPRSNARRLAIPAMRLTVAQVDAYDPNSTQEAVRLRIEQFMAETSGSTRAPEVWVDVTPGTKQMSFGALDAVRERRHAGGQQDVPVSARYIATERNQALWLHPSASGESRWESTDFPPVFDGLRVAPMVAAHGYTLVDKDATAAAPLAPDDERLVCDAVAAAPLTDPERRRLVEGLTDVAGPPVRLTRREARVALAVQFLLDAKWREAVGLLRVEAQRLKKCGVGAIGEVSADDLPAEMVLLALRPASLGYGTDAGH